LLHALVRAFVPVDTPIIIGLDDHSARRRGDKIAAKGIARDAVRSSKAFFVKTSGLRWRSMMLLAPIPWAQRVWALPFLTVLAPSERYYPDRGRPHKQLTDWARQMITQVRHWLPERMLVVVADSSYAALELLAACGGLPQPVTVVTRLRLDAALYDPAPPRTPRQRGAPRKQGARPPTLAQRSSDPSTVWTTATVRWYARGTRTVKVATGTAVWYHSGMPVVPLRWVLITDPQGTFKPQALLCTDVTITPVQIGAWCVLRWQLAVTVADARAHLGIETQRQWSELAMLRTTPGLVGLFSLITLFAHQVLQGQALGPRQAAWYAKAVPPCADTSAFVRQQLWPVEGFWTSPSNPDVVTMPTAVVDRLSDTLAFAA